MRYDVRITLVEQTKKCHNGHKVGDEWVVERFTPAGMCMGAFSSLLPYITTLQFGGSFPWEKTEGAGLFACPDHRVCNVFRLERIEDSAR